MVKTPSIPNTPLPAPPPTPMDPGILEARRRERLRAARAGGLASTIHTSPQGASGSPLLGVPSALGGGS